MIKLVSKLTTGWKSDQNKRFGFCLVLQFIDDKTDKVVFEYAPNLEDKDVFGVLFDKLDKLDAKHKEYIDWVRTNIDPKFVPGKC